jgi:hypothetical protein
MQTKVAMVALAISSLKRSAVSLVSVKPFPFHLLFHPSKFSMQSEIRKIGGKQVA